MNSGFRDLTTIRPDDKLLLRANRWREGISLPHVLSSLATRWRLLSAATRSAIIVYLLAVIALWWSYPHQSRLTIEAGPSAYCVGFSPDGQSMLTEDITWDVMTDQPPSSEPRFARVWNVDSGRQLLAIPLEGKDRVGYSPDGKHFFTGARIYGAKTGKELPGHRGSYKFSNRYEFLSHMTRADGQRIVLGLGGDVIDESSGEIRFQVPGFTHDGMNHAAFTANGDTLAVAFYKLGTADTGHLSWSVKFFDPLTGEERALFAEGHGHVRQLAFSPDGSKLALAVFYNIDHNGVPIRRNGQDKPVDVEDGIQIWDVVSGQREQTLAAAAFDMENCNDLRYLTDGRVITMNAGFKTLVWDLSVPPPHTLSLGTAKHLPAKKSDDEKLREDFQRLTMSLLSIPDSLVTLSTNAHFAAAWSAKSEELLVWQLGDGMREPIYRGGYEGQSSVIPLEFTLDRRLIVSVMSSGRDLGLSPPVREFLEKTGKIIPCLAPEYLSGQRARYDVIDPLGGRLIGQVPHVSGSNYMRASLDGRTLVSSEFRYNFSDKFTLWNVPTPTPWLAIVGWAMLPAVALRLLASAWGRFRRKKVRA